MIFSNSVDVAAKALMAVFSDARPDDDTRSPGVREFYARSSKGGNRYVVSAKARKAIENAAKAMVSATQDDYPMSAAIETLWGVVLDAKDENTPGADLFSRFSAKVRAIQEGFGATGDWEYVTGLSSLNMEGRPTTIANCRFFVLSQQELSELHNRFLASGPSLAAQLWHNLGFHRNGPLQSLIGTPVASARVRAIDQKHAESLGLTALQESVNALCYALAAVAGFGRPFPELRSGVSGGLQCGLSFRLDTPDMTTNQRFGPPYGQPTTMIRQAPGWDSLLAILATTHQARSELAKRIITALGWCNNTAFAKADSIRLVSLATAFETIFISRGESLGKKAKLKERISTLAETDPIRRRKLALLVGEIYRRRSECLHCGDHYVEPDFVEETMGILAKSIGLLTTEQPFANMTTLQEFVAWVDAQ